jgi:hypothetical protein
LSRLIVAPRQSVQNLNDALALPVNSHNHTSIATAVSHPDCRSLRIQIVALQAGKHQGHRQDGIVMAVLA